MRCEEAMTILEILRLAERGHSLREIAAGANCSRSTAGEVLRRCREANCSYEQAQGMTGESLRKLVYPAYTHRKPIKPEPDFGYIHAELKKHPHLNLQFLWEEYDKQQTEQGFSGLRYSQFCLRYRQWGQTAGKKVTMHQEREPGKELFVDWMGEKPLLVIDRATGEIQAAHFFVGTLGDSGYPYVEAFPDEKSDHWLQAHVHAFAHYGGIPRVIVPDNCKTAVKSPQRYDPVLNPAYRELAAHYEVAVIPARIREPQDKSAVEEGVRWLETWLLGWLRNQRFFSFGELNAAVRVRLEELIRRSYQKRSGTRLSVFEELDYPNLRPLPSAEFETATMVLRTVPDNYHVEYGGFYYSVPYTAYRQKVTLRVTATVIEVLNADRLRIASHPRRHGGKRYITIPDHMPMHHRAYWESNQYNGERYRHWAEQIGPDTFVVIDRMLTAQSAEEQAYKACMGLLQLSKKYSAERLEQACARAVALHSFTYTTVANILKNGQDLLWIDSAPPRVTPPHDNVRGADYYV